MLGDGVTMHLATWHEATSIPAAVDRYRMCRTYVSKQVAQQLRPELEAAVKRMDSLGGSYSPDPGSCAKRKLKNQALLLLSASGELEILQELLLRQREASNMTDELAAVAALANVEGDRCSTRPTCRHLGPPGVSSNELSADQL